MPLLKYNHLKALGFKERDLRSPESVGKTREEDNVGLLKINTGVKRADLNQTETTGQEEKMEAPYAWPEPRKSIEEMTEDTYRKNQTSPAERIDALEARNEELKAELTEERAIKNHVKWWQLWLWQWKKKSKQNNLQLLPSKTETALTYNAEISEVEISDLDFDRKTIEHRIRELRDTKSDELSKFLSWIWNQVYSYIEIENENIDKVWLYPDDRVQFYVLLKKKNFFCKPCRQRIMDGDQHKKIYEHLVDNGIDPDEFIRTSERNFAKLVKYLCQKKGVII